MVETKDKKSIKDLFLDSESSDSDSGHDLSHYVTNRVKLIKKIFKVMSAKRIVQMAPQCIKNKPIAEIKSLLLDELMGISNERLLSVIHNKPREGTSSSDSDNDRPKRTKIENEEEIYISLDDITDDEMNLDDVQIITPKIEKMDTDSDNTESSRKKSKKKKKKISVKKEPGIKYKKEKIDTPSTSTEKQKNEPVFSALNLLELELRARAIRSQLKIETKTDSQDKNETQGENETQNAAVEHGGDSPNSVVIMSPTRDIVVIHSDSENSDKNKSEQKKEINKTINPKTQMETDNDVLIMTISHDFDRELSESTNKKTDEGNKNDETKKEENSISKKSENENKNEERTEKKNEANGSNNQNEESITTISNSVPKESDGDVLVLSISQEDIENDFTKE